jgi:hypothetical protein
VDPRAGLEVDDDDDDDDDNNNNNNRVLKQMRHKDVG